MPDTIDWLVRVRAEEHGDKPMVIDTQSRISYAELQHLVDDASLREVFDQRRRAGREMLGHCGAREVFVVLFQGR
jgi:hypothetical protein